MRVLFVCSANVCRSRMAEQVFRDVTAPGARGHEVRSAGTVADPSGHQLTEADLKWADLVCVMESAHRAYITERWGDSAAKVRVLGIPDIYVPGDPVLQDLLRTHILLLLAESTQ
ncbi:MAG: protein-tyrosine-phosphatase [Actinomycetota bacterium]